MKPLLTFLLLPLFSFCQSKSDTKITATPSDTTHLFSKLITLLYTEDYIVRVEDSARGIIITEPKKIKGQNTLIRLKLFIQSSTVELRAEMDDNINWSIGASGKSPSFDPVQYRGMKGSIYRRAWDEADRVARLIGPVTYSK